MKRGVYGILKRKSKDGRDIYVATLDGKTLPYQTFCRFTQAMDDVPQIFIKVISPEGFNIAEE